MKDALGHGSAGRGSRTAKPLKGHAFHTKTNDELRYIAKDANEAAQAMRGHNSQAEGKYLDQVNDAHTVLGYRDRTGAGPDNADASRALAQGHDKSGAVPTHDAHSYNPGAVNDAIAAQNRSGRGRIGGKEASAIHRLLKGRH